MPTSRSNSNRIGITIGDPAGIGAEVIAKALAKPAVRRLARFWVIGDANVFMRYAPRLPKGIEFIDTASLKGNKIKTGKASLEAAAASLAYLEKAVSLIKDQEISSIVTGPVCKQAIARIHPSFQGHTEYLAEAFKVKHPGMLFVAPGLRSIIVTRHLPLNKVSRAVTSDAVYNTITTAYTSLVKQFRIKQPRIAVCGLNPHAGEGGLLGNEDQDKIMPAIKRAQRRGIKAKGPFPADTIYAPVNSKKYDVIVAMYHDQGLIPVKALYFSRLVNVTIGLPFIRTSPAHGTAFDLAGQNRADPSSMRAAIELAAHLS